MSRVALVLLIFSSLLFSNQACKNFTLAIDIGHTPKRWGATSSMGVKEYAFNKRLAFELYEQAIKEGFCNTFIINPNSQEISLTARTQVAKQKKADLFLSLHHDSAQEKYLSYRKVGGVKQHYSYHHKGYSLFYSRKNPHSKKSLFFAKILGEELTKHSLTPTLHHAEKIRGENRKLVYKKLGVYEFTNLVVLKKTAMPAVLLESGIIINPDEEALLNTPSYRAEIISSILNAVKRYAKPTL